MHSTKKKQIQVKRVAPQPQEQLAVAQDAVDFAREQLRSAGRVASSQKSATAAKLPRRQSNTGLFIGGAFLIALSFFQMGSRSNHSDAFALSSNPDLASEYDGVPAAAMVGESFEVNGAATRPNPKISALEMFFCRGRQTAKSCSGKAYHPYLRWWQEWSEDPTTPIQYKEQAVKEITATFGDNTYAE